MTDQVIIYGIDANSDLYPVRFGSEPLGGVSGLQVSSENKLFQTSGFNFDEGTYVPELTNSNIRFSAGGSVSGEQVFDLENPQYKGASFSIEITPSAATTFVVTIEGRGYTPNADPTNIILQSQVIANANFHTFKIYPGITDVPSLAVSDILPRYYTIRITPNDGDSFSVLGSANYVR